jgi:hypothetical protein
MDRLREGAKADEQDLWRATLAGVTPRTAGWWFDIPRRRVEYLCGKWGRRGIYEWGVSIDLGWPSGRCGPKP